MNALSQDLYGDRLLELPQERALLDVYKPTRTPEEFRSRVASIATLCTPERGPAAAETWGRMLRPTQEVSCC